MKRWLTFVFMLALAVALGGVVSRVPKALAEVEAFRVEEVRLRGARFLTHEDAVKVLDLSDQVQLEPLSQFLYSVLPRVPHHS